MLAGLVLAAGAGRRFGGPKALVRHDGVLLVEQALTTLRAAGCQPSLVVLGACADQVRAAADLGDAVVVDNPSWPTGMGSSLRRGLAALATSRADAVVVLLVDMPGIGAAAVRRVTEGAGPDTLAAASYLPGRPGHPVVLGRAHWPGVAASAVGDVGARPYLRRHVDQVRLVPCADVADPTDLDRPADLDRLGPGTIEVSS